MVKVVKYNKNYKGSYQLHKDILKEVVLSDDTESRYREELFIKDICKKVKVNQTVMYKLQIDNNTIGLISTSVTSIKEQPSLQIDYIFISKPYRGIKLDKLNQHKPFRYLIKLLINTAERIQEDVGLKYIVLSPDNDELKSKYKNLNFLPLSDDWMYKKI